MQPFGFTLRLRIEDDPAAAAPVGEKSLFVCGHGETRPHRTERRVMNSSCCGAESVVGLHALILLAHLFLFLIFLTHSNDDDDLQLRAPIIQRCDRPIPNCFSVCRPLRSRRAQKYRRSTEPSLPLREPPPTAWLTIRVVSTPSADVVL